MEAILPVQLTRSARVYLADDVRFDPNRNLVNLPGEGDLEGMTNVWYSIETAIRRGYARVVEFL